MGASGRLDLHSTSSTLLQLLRMIQSCETATKLLKNPGGQSIPRFIYPILLYRRCMQNVGILIFVFYCVDNALDYAEHVFKCVFQHMPYCLWEKKHEEYSMCLTNRLCVQVFPISSPQIRFVCNYTNIDQFNCHQLNATLCTCTTLLTIKLLCWNVVLTEMTCTFFTTIKPHPLQ